MMDVMNVNLHVINIVLIVKKEYVMNVKKECFSLNHFVILFVEMELLWINLNNVMMETLKMEMVVIRNVKLK